MANALQHIQMQGVTFRLYNYKELSYFKSWVYAGRADVVNEKDLQSLHHQQPQSCQTMSTSALPIKTDLSK